MRSCRNSAEIIRIDGETVFVDRKFDVCVNAHKQHVAHWQAVWLKVVVHADTRDEVVSLIEDRIKRKKALKQLEEYFLQRRIRKAVDDLVATRRLIE